MAGADGTSRLSSGIVRNLLGNGVGPLAGLVSAPILAHTLGIEGRGLVAGATAPLLLVTVLATFGLPEALTYFVARSPASVRAIRRRGGLLVLLAGAIATGATVLLAPVLADGTPGLADLMLLASAALVPTVLVAALRGSAAGLGQWTRVAAERSIGPVVRLVAVAVLAATGHLTVPTATAAIAFSPILGGLAYLSSGRAVDEPWAVRGRGFRALVGYGWRVWFGAIAGVLLMRVDQVLMVPLSSTYQLGLYVVAVTVSELPLVLNTAIREVVFASDARSSEDARLTAAARISFLCCAVLAMVLGVSSPWWLPIAFGAGFASAVPTLAVLLVAVALGIPGSVAGAGLSGRGFPHLRSTSLVLACVVNVALLAVLVPIWGALGAAVSTLVGNLVSSNVNVWHVRRRFGIPVRDFYVVRAADVRRLLHLGQRLARVRERVA